MKITRYIILCCLVVVFVGSLTYGCAAQGPAPSGAPITLVFSTHDPDKNHMVVGIYKPWFDMIEQKTGGKVKFEMHYNGELAGPPQAYDSLIKGVFDMTTVMIHATPDFELEQIVASPLYDTFSWRPGRVLNELYQKYPEMQKQYGKIKPLLIFCMSPGWMGTSKKQVKSFEESAGLKMICGGPFPAKRAQALGQVPVSTAPPEFFQTIEKGIADGGNVVTLPEAITYRWVDIIKNIHNVPMLQGIMSVFMNKQTWDKLPADVQKAFTDTQAQAIEMADKSQILAYKDAYSRMAKEFGVNMITLPPSELAKFVKADEPVRAEFVKSLDAKGLPGSKFHADYVSLSKKYAAAEYEIK
ncbi:MAG: hypothetical protein A2Z02_02350 [Chloroflexi bacterium RBG_16_48_7]|nr:MAG: hypothetical protein A2Z02_02350 [Chloroflexi bacterium RBG_16_48_7]